MCTETSIHARNHAARSSLSGSSFGRQDQHRVVEVETRFLTAPFCRNASIAWRSSLARRRGRLRLLCAAHIAPTEIPSKTAKRVRGQPDHRMPLVRWALGVSRECPQAVGPRQIRTRRWEISCTHFCTQLRGYTVKPRSAAVASPQLRRSAASVTQSVCTRSHPESGKPYDSNNCRICGPLPPGNLFPESAPA